MNEGIYILDITDEDMEVCERWLIKISAIEVEETDDDGEIFVSRKLIFEIIEKYAPNVDVALELGYEVSKVPIYVNKKDAEFILGVWRKE